MAVFPTGYPDATALARTMKVFADDGTRNLNVTIAQILSQLVLADMEAKLMEVNDTIEDVASTVTTYNVGAGEKNKTKRFLCANACAVTIPAGLPRGYLMDWMQDGPGILTFQSVAGAGQVIQSPAGLRSGGQYGRGTIEQVAAGIWNLSGFTQV